MCCCTQAVVTKNLEDARRVCPAPLSATVYFKYLGKMKWSPLEILKGISGLGDDLRLGSCQTKGQRTALYRKEWEHD